MKEIVEKLAPMGQSDRGYLLTKLLIIEVII